MLLSPNFIKEHNNKIDAIYKEGEAYVKVSLPLEIPEEAINIIIINQIVKSILEKFPEKEEFFLDLSFNNNLDFNVPLFGSRILFDIQEEFGSIDIFFINYDELSSLIQKHIHTFIRVGCVCQTGKLLFHIISNYRMSELIKQNHSFDTFCHNEKILLGHEIQELYISDEIVIDDYLFKRDKTNFANTSITYQKDFWNKTIDSELFFNQFRNKENYIRNKSDDSHEAIWFGPLNYKYGSFKELKAEPLPIEIKQLAEEIEIRIGFPKDFFNSVYINRYNKAGMGFHHDNDLIFRTGNKKWSDGKDIVVAVFSIGAVSKITIQNRTKDAIPLSIVAEDNSLYVMNKDFQNNLLHKVGVSKGLRYSYTFRHCV